MIKCQVCGKDTPKIRPHQKYCNDCRADAYRKQSAAWIAAHPNYMAEHYQAKRKAEQAERAEESGVFINGYRWFGRLLINSRR